MDNFRLLYQTAVNAGVKCYITTTQPRDFNPNVVMMQYQRDLVDSIQNNFGANSIDFWNDLVSVTPPNNIKPEVAYVSSTGPDGIHVNDIGHRYLYLRVLAKPLFAVNSPLPLKLAAFNANRQNNSVVLKWTTTEEEPDTKFEIQRSANGREFSTLVTLNASGGAGSTNYSWADQQPLDGKSYYRLKIIEPSKTSYSKIISIPGKNKLLSIQSAYADGSNLHLNIFNQRTGTVEISIVSLSGALVKKQSVTTNGSGQLTINISYIPSSEYIIRIADSFGNLDTQRFVKLK